LDGVGMIAVMNKGFVGWVDGDFGVLRDFIYDSSWVYRSGQFVPPNERDFDQFEPRPVIFEEAYWMVLE